MDIKLDGKIRRLLGNDYHLCSLIREPGKVERWSLYRYYEDHNIYFSELNKPIMTSETNTAEELYKYAKKHYKWNLATILSKANFIIGLIALIVLIINIFVIKNDTLRRVVLTVNLCSIFTSTIILIVDSHNINVSVDEHIESIKKIIGGKE